MDKKKEIVRLWKKTKQVHPSYREIATKTKVTPAYAFRVVKAYLSSHRGK